MKPKSRDAKDARVDSVTLKRLFDAALKARANAAAKDTKVGCGLVDESGRIWVGCNVEHCFLTATIHAETNAIGSMVAGGGKKASALVIVSARDFFTPCGGCCDMIMQYGSGDCEVISMSPDGKIINTSKITDLMPKYPR